VLIASRITTYLIVKEKSASTANGEDFHVHVFLRTEKRSHIKTKNRLDLSENEKSLHGNYQASKNMTATLEYMLKDISIRDQNDLKDKDMIFSEDLKLQITDSCRLLTFSETMIDLGEKGLYKEALSLLKKEKPDSYYKERKLHTKLLAEHYAIANGAVYDFKFKDFIFPQNLEITMNKAEVENKTLMLMGPSGCGKTKFIEAYLESKGRKPLVINDINSIKDFDKDSHDCIVFDDVDWSKVAREQMIKLLDSNDPTTFRVTHGSVSIPSKTPRFVLSNKSLQSYVEYDVSSKENKAITRRYISYQLGNELLYLPLAEQSMINDLADL